MSAKIDTVLNTRDADLGRVDTNKDEYRLESSAPSFFHQAQLVSLSVREDRFQCYGLAFQ